MRTPKLPTSAWIAALGLVLAGATALPNAMATHGNGHGHHPGFVEVTLAKDVLRCAAGTPFLATDDACGPLDNQQPQGVKVNIPAGADAIIVEMRWTPTGAFGGKTLAMTLPVAIGGGNQRPEGLSILRAEVKVPPGGLAHAETIFVEPGASHDLGLVLEQPVEIAVSSFVDAPVPPGYSAFA